MHHEGRMQARCEVEETVVREHMSRCLRRDEELLALQRVAVKSSMGAPPVFEASSPFAWLGLTPSRLITMYEASGALSSIRYSDLAEFKVSRWRFRPTVTWRLSNSIDGETAVAGRRMLRIARKLARHPECWVPLAHNTTECASRHRPAELPALTRLDEVPSTSRDADLEIECVRCGQWCGFGDVEQAALPPECPGCLCEIIHHVGVSGLVEAVPRPRVSNPGRRRDSRRSDPTLLDVVQD
jgi:hypothetical protein